MIVAEAEAEFAGLQEESGLPLRINHRKDDVNARDLIVIAPLHSANEKERLN